MIALCLLSDFVPRLLHLLICVGGLLCVLDALQIGGVDVALLVRLFVDGVYFRF